MKFTLKVIGAISLSALFLYLINGPMLFTPMLTAMSYLLVGATIALAGFLSLKLYRAYTRQPLQTSTSSKAPHPYQTRSSHTPPKTTPTAGPKPVIFTGQTNTPTHPAPVSTPTPIEPPENYLCEITFELMVDPVKTPGNHIYERAVIETHIDKSNHYTFLPMHKLPYYQTPQPKTIYIDINNWGLLTYKVASLQGVLIQGTIQEIPVVEELTSALLNPEFRSHILAITSQRNHTYGTEPITQEPLLRTMLIPQRELQKEIQQWCQAHPEDYANPKLGEDNHKFKL